MGAYLLRVVKILTQQNLNVAWNEKTPAPYESSIMNHDYIFNEYMLDLDELIPDEIQFIINTIVHAERCLMIGPVPVVCMLYDLEHYLVLGINSACKIFTPTSSTETRGVSAQETRPATWGKAAYNDTDRTIKYYPVFERQEYVGYTFRNNNSGRFAYNGNIRMFTIGQDCDQGRMFKRQYAYSVSQRDVSIDDDGNICVNMWSELLHTRMRLYDHYMKYVDSYMSNYSVSREGILIQTRFSIGKFNPTGVQDNKARMRYKNNLPLYCNEAKVELLGLISQFIIALNQNIEGMNAWGWNVDCNLPPSNIFTTGMTFARQAMRMLMGYFPYLLNDRAIDVAIINPSANLARNISVPLFSYKDLKEVFERFEKYYYYFESLKAKFGTSSSTTTVTWVYSPPSTYLPRYVLPNNFPALTGAAFHNARRDRLREIRDNYYDWCQSVIDMQYLFGQLERVFGVAPYDPNAYVKNPKKIVPIKAPGRKAVYTRSQGDSGKAFPRKFWQTPTTTREKENALRMWRESAPLPLEADKAAVWFWSTPTLNRMPIVGGDIEYFEASPPPIVPPTPPTPVHKEFVWDNTIHPLDPEDEDQEAIDMLEGVEENARGIGKKTYLAARVVGQYFGVTVPPVVDGLVSIGIDVLADKINPTDRTKISLPGTSIVFNGDGEIPVTRGRKGEAPANSDVWKWFFGALAPPH